MTDPIALSPKSTSLEPALHRNIQSRRRTRHEGAHIHAPPSRLLLYQDCEHRVVLLEHFFGSRRRNRTLWRLRQCRFGRLPVSDPENIVGYLTGESYGT